MTDKKNKSIVEHHYHIPKTETPSIENLREITLTRLNESITIKSSYPEEDIMILCNLALDLLNRIQVNKT